MFVYQRVFGFSFKGLTYCRNQQLLFPVAVLHAWLDTGMMAIRNSIPNHPLDGAKTPVNNGINHLSTSTGPQYFSEASTVAPETLRINNYQLSSTG